MSKKSRKSSGIAMDSAGNGEGNTSVSRARAPVRKFWCFTLNNFTMDSMDSLIKEFEKAKVKYFFGEEIAPTTGTPHLQGFIKVNTKLGIRAPEKFENKKIHWEVAQGSEEQNIEYCKKGGKIHTNMEFVRDPMDNIEKKWWQKEMEEIINGKIDERKIYWYWSKEGKVGKTYFAKHLCLAYNALYINGKASDAKCAIVDMIKEKNKTPRVVVFGYPRSCQDYVSYTAIEEIKDGLFFSGKYESAMCIYNQPHVFVLCNFEPDLTKLSQDRWEVKNIDEN